jgi:hypothetical protein
MTRSFHVSLLTGAALATMMIMAPGALASTRAATPSPSPSPNAQVPVQQGTDVAALPGATAFGNTRRTPRRPCRSSSGSGTCLS